jgi:hypothetical protein
MEYSKYRFTLDIHKAKSQVSIPVMLGDTNIKFIISLNDGGTPYQIAEGCTVMFAGRKPSGKFVYHKCEIEENRIIYTFNENTASELGTINCDLRIHGKVRGNLTVPRFFITVEEKAVSDEEIEGYIESSPDLGGLKDIYLSELNRVNAELGREAAEEVRVAFYESILRAKEQGKLNGKDGITPRVRINALTNYWEVSYDEGYTWTTLGVEASVKFTTDETLTLSEKNVLSVNATDEIEDSELPIKSKAVYHELNGVKDLLEKI